MSTPLSRDAHQRLSEEFADLTTRGRVEIARQIEIARQLGDLKENSDYHAAKDAQGKMESRVRQLAALLEDVEIVDEQAAGFGDTVAAGTVVAIRYDGDDDAERFLVGSIEEKPDDEVSIVSPESPLGKALIGARAGDTVTYEAPGGTLKIEVVSVG